MVYLHLTVAVLSECGLFSASSIIIRYYRNKSRAILLIFLFSSQKDFCVKKKKKLHACFDLFYLFTYPICPS